MAAVYALPLEPRRARSPLELRADEPVLGPAHGVEVVLYGSPLCPFASATLSAVEEARSRVPVRLAFRHLYYGLDSGLGELAAAFCLAAERQGAFWDAMAWLGFRGVAGLSEPGSFSRRAGLDASLLRADLQRDVQRTISQHVAEAQLLRVERAPALFVGGEELTEFAHERLVDHLEGLWLEAHGSEGVDSALPATLEESGERVMRPR